MKNIRIFLLLTFIILHFGCTESSIISEEEKVRIANEIQERLDGYPRALEEKSIEWFRNFWANEDDFLMALDGTITSDYEIAITKTYTDFFNNFKEIIHFEFSNGKAHIINRNTVSFATSFDWGVIYNSGDTLRSKGSGIYLFEKHSGDWKALQVAGTHQYY